MATSTATAVATLAQSSSCPSCPTCSHALIPSDQFCSECGCRLPAPSSTTSGPVLTAVPMAATAVPSTTAVHTIPNTTAVQRTSALGFAASSVTTRLLDHATLIIELKELMSACYALHADGAEISAYNKLHAALLAIEDSHVEIKAALKTVDEGTSVYSHNSNWWVLSAVCDKLISEEQKGAAVDQFLYYWDARDGKSWEGWWFTPNEVGSTRYVQEYCQDLPLIRPRSAFPYTNTRSRPRRSPPRRPRPRRSQVHSVLRRKHSQSMGVQELEEGQLTPQHCNLQLQDFERRHRRRRS